MNKGMIMSVGKKYATVYTQDCQVVKVKWQPSMMVGEEFDLSAAEKAPARSRQPYMKFALAAVCLVVLLAAGIILPGILVSPVYARLSIDVNPSVEFTLNRSLQVIEAVAINDDAAPLLAGQSFTGLSWQAAVEKWVSILKIQNTLQVQNMLISAVCPADAEQLKVQLINLEETGDLPLLNGIDVRVIYSSDQAVVNQAKLNGLSVGRQMLLNQSRLQEQNYDEATIADAPLGTLVGELLRKGDRDQTRLTTRETQSLSEQTGEPSGSQASETNRETNRETNASQQGSQSGSQQGSQSGSQQGSFETYQQTNRETNGSQQGNPTSSPQGSQQTLQSTIQQTSSDCSKCSSESQQTSQIKATIGR